MLVGDHQELHVALTGRYTIERELGAGGMATVYLADDIRHGRKVALKVLRPDLAATLGADRFLSEIRTTANLQHPHILPLHDSGAASGFLYYVMPYVQGESLRDRLTRERQLPIDDALRIAREVADALSYAHERGVIHRDIKPENILIQGSHAVVADFGIALAVQQAGGARMTQTGLSLGTPQYMAPEQAMGERVIDKRADVYALGAVTYEMLTGEPPFTGASVQSIVAKVMTERPVAPRTLRDTVPETAEAAVLKALAKLPADRFATTADFAAAIGVGTATTIQAPRVVAARRSRVTVGAIAAAVLFGALALWGWMRGPQATTEESRRFSIVLPDSSPLLFVGPTAFAAGQRSLALSPDGRRLVYMGAYGSSTSLFERDLATFAVTRIVGTERAYHPFFSPDGRSIAFFVGSELRRMDVAGGPITAVASIDVPTGAVWGSDGYIVVSERNGQALVRVRETGGLPQRVSREGDRRNFPELLPGTPYVVHSNSRRLAATNIETGVAYLLTPDGPVPTADANNAEVVRGTSAVYLKAGYLLWMSVDGSILASRFDPATLKFAGRVLVVATGVRRESSNGAGQFAVSDGGVLAYVAGSNADIGHLAWVYEGGRKDTLPFVPGMYGTTDISPDGRRMVGRVTQLNGRLQNWIFDFTRGVAQQLSINDDFQFGTTSRWTPDSKHLVHGASKTLTGESFIVRISPDQPGALDTLGRTRAVVDAPTFTASGDTMVLVATDSGRSHLMLLGISPRSDPVRIGHARGVVVANPGISPDGKWLTYNSDENTDRMQVFAEPFPPNGRRIQITDNGGGEPAWSLKGDALFYRKDSQIYRVPVASTGEQPFGTPSVFAEGEFADFQGRTYSVHPDGKRLLVKVLPFERGSREIRVHTDLVGELRRLDGETTAQRP